MNVSQQQQQSGSAKKAALPPKQPHNDKRECAQVRRPELRRALAQCRVEGVVNGRDETNDRGRPKDPTCGGRTKESQRKWARNQFGSSCSDRSGRLRDEYHGQTEKSQPPRHSK